MSLPAVLIRKSTGEIIKRGLYPREDMALIDGLDPDLEWLLVYIPYEAPDYDPRVFVLTTTESITTQPHPDYIHLNQFLVTYNTVKRDIESIESSIVEEFRSSRFTATVFWSLTAKIPKSIDAQFFTIVIWLSANLI